MAVQCPSCGSTETTRNTRGTTSIGTPRIILSCLECGFQWTPGFSGQDQPKSRRGCRGCLAVILIAFGLVAVFSLFSRKPPAPFQQSPAVNAPPKPSPVPEAKRREGPEPSRPAQKQVESAAKRKAQNPPTPTTASKQPGEPVEDKSPEEAARDKYGYLVNQAKQLIKTNLNSAARAKLLRVINEAPGTEIAAEAKQILDTLPKE